MDKKIKKITIEMNILMGITLSLALSLLGNIMSGHFTVPGFLISFGISMLMSFAIGALIPARKISVAICKKLKISNHGFGNSLLESFISDIIYTPIITVAMTALAYRNAVKNDADIHYPQMLLGSLGISLIAGYILILITMPIFLRIVFKGNGLGWPPVIPNAENSNENAGDKSEADDAEKDADEDEKENADN